MLYTFGETVVNFEIYACIRCDVLLIMTLNPWIHVGYKENEATIIFHILGTLKC